MLKILFLIHFMLYNIFQHLNMSHFLSLFNKLPLSNKSMVYLMWVHHIGIIIVEVFINIYIFQINQSLLDVAIYNMIYYWATFLGFSWIGWYMAHIQKNIKYMYYIAYTMCVWAFLPVIFTSWDYNWILIFALIYGTWYGAFWNAAHSQELKNITDKDRDFYSSSISVGMNMVQIVIPLCIAILFYITWALHLDGYTLLFFILPTTYLASSIFISRISNYTPQKISQKDVKNFFHLKKYKAGHIYYLLHWMEHGIQIVIVPVISIMLLKNEINIWFFQWILWIISTYSVMYLATKRTPNNRIQYFIVLGALMFLNYIWFALFYSLWAFIIFSLISIILYPLFRVSSHSYSLSLMDNVKIPGSDFYPSMILREIILTIGRFVAIGILIFFFYYWFDLQTLLQIGIACIGINYILKSGLIYLWDKHEKSS